MTETEHLTSPPSSQEPSQSEVSKSLPKNRISLYRLFGKGQSLYFPVCLFLSLISSVLMILSYPNTGWNILAFIGMVPILFVIETQNKWKTILSFFTFLLVFYWYILDWIAVFHSYALPGLVGYVIFIHFIPLFIYRFFRRWNKVGSIYNAILFATIMVIFEYCRELGFARFPYGNIAYTQYRFLHFIQIVDITGYLGVSYFLYFVNAATAGFLAKLFFTRRKSPPPKTFFATMVPMLANRFIGIGLILIVILFYGNQKLDKANAETPFQKVTATNQSPPQPPPQSPPASPDKSPEKIRVTLVQHWYDYNLAWTQENRDLLLDKLFRITEEGIQDKPDLIIWPESALNDYYEYRVANRQANPNTLAMRYYEFFRRIGKSYPETQFLVGSTSLGEINDETIVEKKSRTAKDVKTGSIVGKVKKYNSALLIDNKGAVIDKSAKILLVPMAEYFPYSGILQTIPWLANILDEAQASQFTPFERYKVINSSKGALATLICYEDAFEALARTLTLHGAAFFVLITNDAWSYSEKSQELHYMFSVFRAIENRRHLLRAGNAGVTGFIDTVGQASHTLPMFEEGYSTFEFTPSDSELTLFTRYGNLFIILMITIFILLIHYSLIMKVWHTFLWVKKTVLKLKNQ